MNRAHTLFGLGLAGALALTACEDQVPPPVAPVAPPPTAQPAPPPADPLGPRPALEAPRAYQPQAPEVFQGPNGLTVWLYERHSLPLVAMTLAIPYGSASDPKGKAGLAHITADMLDEGAGPRNAVEFSTAVNDLGASLASHAGLDGSAVILSVLKKNYKPAFELFADAVARPRFDAKEYKRVHALWKNDLEKRAQDPGSVARVVMAAAVYGADTPYGHPTDGLVSTAAKIDLPAVKAFYAAHYRPDKATLVVAGDVTRAEVTQLLASSALGAWKAPAKPAEPLPEVHVAASAPRLVLVDRADAPQSVIAVTRGGVAASDAKAPLLDLVNTALGGSFTSRLNEDLREEHGWSYGARSGFAETRGVGAFTARASVVTEATGKALGAMIADLDKMATAGLLPEELDKVKAQDRADLVEIYESVSGISNRLATLAELGLPPGFDAQASRARQAAPKQALDGLAPAVSAKGATIVVVGPAAAVIPQLAEAGLGQPEIWDAEGEPAKAAPAKKVILKKK